MSQPYQYSKRSFFVTATSSFIGMLVAVPMVMAMYLPHNNSAQAEGAGQATTAVAKSAQGDYALFAYAYSQGMLAGEQGGSNNPGTCEETSTGEAGGMGSVSGGLGEATEMSTPAYTASHYMPGRGNVGGSGEEGSEHHHGHGAMTVTNAYNTYKSIVENSWSYVNSNNTVGSNNTTSTSVDVKDSKGVVVGVSNDTTGIQTNAANNSSASTANTNSSTTNTTVTTDSNNETTNVNSGNTTTNENSGNTTTTNTEVENSNNTTTDSNNTTEIKDSGNTTTNTETTTVNNEHNNEHNNDHDNTHQS